MTWALKETLFLWASHTFLKSTAGLHNMRQHGVMMRVMTWDSGNLDSHLVLTVIHVYEDQDSSTVMKTYCYLNRQISCSPLQEWVQVLADIIFFFLRYKLPWSWFLNAYNYCFSKYCIGWIEYISQDTFPVTWKLHC